MVQNSCKNKNNKTFHEQIHFNFISSELIRSSDNDSTGFWPPGSLHTLGADGHI